MSLRGPDALWTDVQWPELPEWLPITYNGEIVLWFWAEYVLWIRSLWWYTPDDGCRMQ